MRIVTLKSASDLKKLSSSLATDGGSDEAAVREALQKANPQVDLGKARAGTVLLVPDRLRAASRDDGGAQGAAPGEAIESAAFLLFAKGALQALEASADQLKADGQARLAEHEATLEAIERSEVKQAIAADAELGKAIDEARAGIEADREAWRQSPKELKSMLDSLKDDLSQLAQVLR